MWTVSVWRIVTITLGCVAGALLFFWMYVAMLAGESAWLLISVLGFAVIGALGVMLGGARSSEIATAAILPSTFSLLWIVPGLFTESRPLAALAWPVLVAVLWGIAWVGGYGVVLAKIGRASCRERV